MGTKLIQISLICAIIYCIVASNVRAERRPLGGLEEEKPADDEIRGLVAQVQEGIQSKYPEKFDSIEPLAYKTQLVSGKNYFVRALVHEKDGDKNYAHLRIYKSFRGPVELAAVKPNVPRSRPLEYFQ